MEPIAIPIEYEIKSLHKNPDLTQVHLPLYFWQYQSIVNGRADLLQ